MAQQPALIIIDDDTQRLRLRDVLIEIGYETVMHDGPMLPEFSLYEIIFVDLAHLNIVPAGFPVIAFVPDAETLLNLVEPPLDYFFQEFITPDRMRLRIRGTLQRHAVIDGYQKAQKALTNLIRQNTQFNASINAMNVAMVITDPQQAENPIVYVNPAFTSITGYAPDDVIGRNCRFLQGPESDPRTIDLIRQAIARRENFQGIILNYRKDGSTFWNDLTISPIFNDAGELVNFVGIQHDLSDAQRVSNPREEREQMMQMIFRESPDAIITLDGKSRVIAANPAAHRMFGIAHHELINLDARTLVVLDNLQNLKSYRQLRETGQYRGEVILIRGDNSTFTGEISIAQFSDKSGTIRTIAVVRDISARKQMEQERQFLSDLTTSISDIQKAYIESVTLNHIGDFILDEVLRLTQSEYGFIGEVVPGEDGQPMLKTFAITDIAWNAETRAVYAAQAPFMEFTNLNSLFGHTLTHGEIVISNEPSGDPRSGGLPHGHPALNAYMGLPLYRGERMVGMIGVANRPDGYSMELARSLKPLTSSVGSIIHAERIERAAIAVRHDLQRAEAHLKTIVETSIDGIILLNEEGNILTINPAVLKMFEYEQSDELIGQNISRLIESSLPTSTGALARSITLDDLERNIGARREVDGIRKYGQNFPLEMAVGEAFIGEDRIFVATVHDITERRRAEETTRTSEMLQIELEKEKELSELKSNFTTMVSHEFRNPLAAILASVEILERYNDRLTDEKRAERIEGIKAQIAFLKKMVEDVTFIGKSETVGIDPHFSPIRISEVCRTIIEEVSIAHSPRPKIVTTMFQLPDYLQMDAVLLNQIFTNLLTNAIKYSPEGSPIEVTIGYDNNTLNFEIRDYGIGIPPEDQKRLFETFYRAENVGMRQGTGLGLTIVKRSVDALGGTVDWHSKLNSGTTFHIALPTLIVR